MRSQLSLRPRSVRRSLSIGAAGLLSCASALVVTGTAGFLQPQGLAIGHPAFLAGQRKNALGTRSSGNPGMVLGQHRAWVAAWTDFMQRRLRTLAQRWLPLRFALASTVTLAGALRSLHEQRDEEERRRPDGSPLSELIFLGSGSSSGTPHLNCVMSPSSACVACRDAMANPMSKNRRGNPSLLIRYQSREGGQAGAVNTQRATTTVLIDAGKTFKQSATRFFPKFQVDHISGIVLTHEHADAMLGLDDVRELQGFSTNWRDSGEPEPMPVYLSEQTFAHVCNVFPYLTKRPNVATGGVKRMVSQLKWSTIEPFETFAVTGLEMQALPIQHGTDCVCLGFAFGQRERVVYLSDFSAIPPETMDVLKERHVSVLILDALLPDKDATTHIGLPTALQLARELRPDRTLLVGMGHRFGDHDDVNRQLRDLLGGEAQRCGGQALDVQLAHDGLRLFVDL